MKVRATSPPMEWATMCTGASSANQPLSRARNSSAETFRSLRQSNQKALTLQFSERDSSNSP